MRWFVRGADSDTGADLSLELDAESQADAANQARRKGIFVETVIQVRATPVAVGPARPPSMLPSDDDLDAIAAAANPRRAAPAAPIVPYASPYMPATAPAVFMPPGARPEAIILQTPVVTVTDARVIIFGKTYSVANVTSVQMWTFPAQRGPGIFLLFVALCFGTAGLFGAAVGPALTLVWAVFGVCLLVGGLICVMAKARYAVRLASSSGEIDAVVNRDPRWIASVVAAVNQAIVSRR